MFAPMPVRAAPFPTTLLVALLVATFLALPAQADVVDVDGAGVVDSGAGSTLLVVAGPSASGEVAPGWTLYGYALAVEGDREGGLLSAGLSRELGRGVGARWRGRAAAFAFIQSGEPAGSGTPGAGRDPRDVRARLELLADWEPEGGRGWEVSHRSRLEHRWRDTLTSPGNQWRYRPRVEVGYSDLAAGVSPYTAVEGFFDLSDGVYQSTQLSTGARLGLGGAWSLNAYYGRGFGAGGAGDTDLVVALLGVKF